MLKTFTSIEDVNAPDEIRATLGELTKGIAFSAFEDKGGNGYVFIGKNRLLDTDVVIKFYYWGGDKKTHAEPARLAELKHNSILEVYDASPVDGKWAYFITPLCTDGDLDSLIENSATGNIEAIDIIIKILEGVSYLHAHGYAHRDLKASNIFCSEDEQFKIGDFGSVKKTDDKGHVHSPSNHSLIYRAPETFDGDNYYTVSDLYQVGLLLYQILGGLLPYDETAYLKPRQMKQYEDIIDDFDRQAFARDIIQTKILSGRLLDLSSIPPWVPKRLLSVIRKACHRDATRRYQSANEFLTALNAYRAKTPDWQWQDGYLTLPGSTSYRIIDSGDLVSVQKRKTGNWQSVSKLKNVELETAVKEIESLIS